MNWNDVEGAVLAHFKALTRNLSEELRRVRKDLSLDSLCAIRDSNPVPLE
jgi:hypothetical protein